MLTTPIRAVDERVLPFAPDQIWPVLADVNGYPQWYPPSLHLHVRAVTAAGIGSEVELRPGVAWRQSPLCLTMGHLSLQNLLLLSVTKTAQCSPARRCYE